MCVLASAVDIVILTHREAVTGYPAGHRLASFYTLGQYDGFTRDTLRACHPQRGRGVLTRYIAPARREVWRVVNFYYLCSKETQEEKY